MTYNNVQNAADIAKNGIQMVLDGKVRNHKLGNSARVHTGEVEKRESQQYRDFLSTKNCRIAYELTGSDHYEEY